MEALEGWLLFCDDIVVANGIIGLINYTGSNLARYRESIGRLGGLGIDARSPATCSSRSATDSATSTWRSGG